MAAPRRRLLRAVAAVAALALAAGLVACSDDDGDAEGPKPGGAPADVDRTGELANGTRWRVRAPAEWNGTLLLYSRGSVAPGTESPVMDAPDEITAGALLDQGYALVGSSYEDSGWVLASAMEDQHELLDVVADELGEPERTVAWGSSLGALVTVGLLEQHPDDFAGGVAMCGVIGGVEALWDPFLDVSFVLRTLLLPDEPVELADFRGPARLADERLIEAGTQAYASPQGQARLALAGAVAEVPAWAPGPSPRPTPADALGMVTGMVANLALVVPFTTVMRESMEGTVGGNPSSNVGVDYGALLGASRHRTLVEGFYAAAGLDLQADLAALAAAPRVEADPAARAELLAPVDPTGELAGPLLTLHDTGDGLALPFHPREYAERVAAAGRSDLLRGATVERAGHCYFTGAEQLVALGVVLERLDTGAWPDTGAAALNAAATALGPGANVYPAPDGTTAALDPAFVDAELPRSPRSAGS
jgi:pimeloyl-ACP methyl ester carboxylesterase